MNELPQPILPASSDTPATPPVTGFWSKYGCSFGIGIMVLANVFVIFSYVTKSRTSEEPIRSLNSNLVDMETISDRDLDQQIRDRIKKAQFDPTGIKIRGTDRSLPALMIDDRGEELDVQQSTRCYVCTAGEITGQENGSQEKVKCMFVAMVLKDQLKSEDGNLICVSYPVSKLNGVEKESFKLVQGTVFLLRNGSYWVVFDSAKANKPKK